MKVLLVLVLLLADGPKQTQLEQESIDACWTRAHAIIEKAQLQHLDGVVGVGAGCIVILPQTQESDGR